MVTYEELLGELKALSESDFAVFQRRIINDGKLKMLGVRTPAMRKLAKKYKGQYETFSRFPNEYYEVAFLKLSLAALLPYEQFTGACDDCVGLLTDWALCDCFSPACISKRRDDFVPFIKSI